MGRREKQILLLLAAAQFILTLDTTVMNVSISNLVVDLKTNVASIQSAITFYALVMAAFMIAGAKIGDIVGRKKTFMIGLLIYGAGSLITGLSVNVTMLKFGWSLLEGLGAALMMPAMLSLINGNFQSTKSRIQAFSTVAAMAAIGAAAGPIIGGLLTTYASWRWAFLGEVAIVLVILARRKLIKDVAFQGKVPSFDYLGMVLCVVGLATLVQGILLVSGYGLVTARNSYQLLGFIDFETGGLSPALTLIAAGGVILAVFGFVEWRRVMRGRPNLVDIRLLKRRAVRSGVLTVMSQQFIIAALMYAIALYLQLELGYSAFRTGIALLPLSIGILLLARGAARLASRYAPRDVIMAGFGLMIVGLGAVGLKFVTNPATTSFAIALFVIGAGIGLVVSQLQNLVLSSVSKNESSETSGLMTTFQNLGASLGTAISGAVMVTILITASANLINANPTFTASQKQQINQAVEQHAAIVSDQALESQLRSQPDAVSNQIVDINAQARQKAISYTFIAVAVLGLLGLVAATRLPKEPV